MYHPHEIFARLPAPIAEQLFGFLHDKEKPLYKATIETLAKQRKLRGLFIERKPRGERHEWMRSMKTPRSFRCLASVSIVAL